MMSMRMFPLADSDVGRVQRGESASEQEGQGDCSSSDPVVGGLRTGPSSRREEHPSTHRAWHVCGK